MELSELYLNEAKQHHNDLTMSIRETRNKSWQLYVGILAIEAYLVTSNLTILNIGLLILTSVFLLVITFIFRMALEPLRNQINGIEPREINGLTEVEVVAKYQKMIDETTGTLDKLSDRFKWALGSTLIWSIVAILWFLFSKSLFCCGGCGLL